MSFACTEISQSAGQSADCLELSSSILGLAYTAGSLNLTIPPPMEAVSGKTSSSWCKS